MSHTLLFMLQNIQNVPVRFEASSGRQNVTEYNYIYKNTSEIVTHMFLYT